MKVQKIQSQNNFKSVSPGLKKEQSRFNAENGQNGQSKMPADFKRNMSVSGTGLSIRTDMETGILKSTERISFKSGETNLLTETGCSETTAGNAKKESFTDKFSTRIKNSADLNDCVSVPRSVFKGYLAFMLGTAALTLGSFIPQKAKKVKNFILVAGNLVNLFGIWSFVRPYIVKDAAPTVKGGQR